MMQQLTLDINSGNNYLLEDFIVSYANKEAYEKVTNWQVSTFGVSPLPYSCLIYGPSASGKTFITKVFANSKKIYQIFPLQALDESIFNKYAGFCIDDIENFLPEQLLQYINISHESKKPLLLTSSSKYTKYPLLDLSSRINAMLKIELLPPDDELMKMLLFKNFSTASIKCSPQLLQFLLTKLPRDFYSIIKLTNKIISYALMHKKNINIPLVKKVLQI